ncbi:TOMM precursor leader peptide-binding protein [Photobacterium sp. GJ3]|uniref:TOMM precursor leader peptide-binding protein n=1 Tax=Photobacterium sp. GJ3 TaxID=2829502 RepID=UPI001B8D5AAF|nr:TOMM precursor leader peptide-binding protein [Photobacterium sp. GJ3]QUJ67505.1 TOMM precursor leader peptide-binding protein [Photobacterium sp. GJ3]
MYTDSYFLSPSVVITKVSDNKVQIADHINEFTIEDQNAAFDELIHLIRTTGFTLTDLEQSAQHEVIHEIFSFMLSFGFIQQGKILSKEALHADIKTIQLMNTPDDLKLTALNKKSVNLYGSGYLFERVYDELNRMAYSIQDNPSSDRLESSLIVVCSDSDNVSYFSELNQLSFEKALPVLFASIDKSDVRIGPLVIPEQSSCYQCLLNRMLPNIKYKQEFDGKFSQKNVMLKRQAEPQMYAMYAAFHVISQIVKFNHGVFDLCLLNEVLDVNLIDYDLDVRPVLRDPKCQCCYQKQHQSPKKAARALI